LWEVKRFKVTNIVREFSALVKIFCPLMFFSFTKRISSEWQNQDYYSYLLNLTLSGLYYYYYFLEVVMGRDQKFLTWVGSGQVRFLWLGSGQPFMVWAWIRELCMPNFRPLASLVWEENEVTDAHRTSRPIPVQNF